MTSSRAQILTGVTWTYLLGIAALALSLYGPLAALLGHNAGALATGYLLFVPMLVLNRHNLPSSAFGYSLQNWRQAVKWAVGLSLLIFPPFIAGAMLVGPTLFPGHHFTLVWPEGVLQRLFLHTLGVALPEEWFFRGYVQSQMQVAWPAPTRHWFKDFFRPANLATSAMFAAQHLVSVPSPIRLATFFPSLMFGWLRLRTSSVFAAVLFHALCNVLNEVLFQGLVVG